MTQYEYHFEKHNDQVQKREEMVNKLAKKGWELDHVVPTVGHGSVTHTVHYIFRRQID